MGRRTNCFSVLSAQVDRENGVLRGVAVITVGPALGHGMEVDATTLAQVASTAKEYAGGLKVKLDHTQSAKDIVGYLREFRVDGNVLRADLHLLKTSPSREYVLELAETIPDTFGLSISFSGEDEKKGDIYFARCAEIYSADIVSEPAANPSGLFQAGDPTPNDMTPDEIKAAIAEALAPITAELTDLKAKFAQPAGEEQVAEAAKAAALSVLREFQASLPAPTQFSAPPPPAPVAKKFEDIVREFKASGLKHNDAIRKAMAEHPSQHSEYSARVQKGEVILF